MGKNFEYDRGCDNCGPDDDELCEICVKEEQNEINHEHTKSCKMCCETIIDIKNNHRKELLQQLYYQKSYLTGLIGYATEVIKNIDRDIGDLEE